MATKAQQFKSDQQRPKPKAPVKKKPKLAAADTALPGVSATDVKKGVGSTAVRNRSNRSAKNAGTALEDSATTPSRKSTRKSQHHMKPDSTLQRTHQRAASTPSARAARGK